MGAWGYGLFQSDHDLDIISELSDEAGVQELQKKGTKQVVKDGEEEDYGFESICGDYSRNRELVRTHLDSGVLAKMLAKYETKLLSGESEFLREPGYIFMLLGACAMTLGCTIPTKYKTTMQKVYMCVGLPQDALKQMNKALNGPNGYKDGEPYDFESPGLVETANTSPANPQPNGFGFVGMNVWGPGTMFYNPPKGSTKGLDELQAAKANEGKYGKDVCGGCGAKKSEGGTKLLDCGTCKARKYCSKKRQKQQWKFHQEVCKAPEGGPENEEP